MNRVGKRSAREGTVHDRFRAFNVHCGVYAARNAHCVLCPPCGCGARQHGCKELSVNACHAMNVKEASPLGCVSSIRSTFHWYGKEKSGYKTHHLSISPTLPPPGKEAGFGCVRRLNSGPATGCKSTHHFGLISALGLHYATVMVTNLHPVAFLRRSAFPVCGGGAGCFSGVYCRCCTCEVQLRQHMPPLPRCWCDC